MWASLAFTQGVIHVFGDSHASFCFSNQGHLQEIERSFFSYKHDNTIYEVPFVIHWLGPRTMYRVGRDGLFGLNIVHYGVQEGDVVVFIFGEIDVRVHIGRQCEDKGRDLDEIVDTLTSRYIHTLVQNKNLYNNIIFVLASVIPPAPNRVSDTREYPVYGEVQDRVLIAKKLNANLKALAFKNGFLFLDIYSLYADEDGILRAELSDGHVHIGMQYNYLVKNALVDL